MKEIEKLVEELIKDEYNNIVAAHLERYTDDEIEDRTDIFYEKYLSPGISYNSIQRPYNPAKDYFYKDDDPRSIGQLVRERVLIALKEAVYKDNRSFLVYLSETYPFDGPSRVANLLVINERSKLIEAIFSIDLDPSPHWWQAQGNSVELGNFRIVAEKQYEVVIDSLTKEMITDQALRLKINSAAR